MPLSISRASLVAVGVVDAVAVVGATTMACRPLRLFREVHLYATPVCFCPSLSSDVLEPPLSASVPDGSGFSLGATCQKCAWVGFRHGKGPWIFLWSNCKASSCLIGSRSGWNASLRGILSMHTRRLYLNGLLRYQMDRIEMLVANVCWCQLMIRRCDRESVRQAVGGACLAMVKDFGSRKDLSLIHI